MSDYDCLDSVTRTPDYLKDPDATVDYEFTWGVELNGDTIETSTFLLPDGLTSVSTTVTDSTATIFVSGGAQGGIYRVTNRIVTAAGRTMDKTITVLVSEPQ